MSASNEKASDASSLGTASRSTSSAKSPLEDIHKDERDPARKSLFWFFKGHTQSAEQLDIVTKLEASAGKGGDVSTYDYTNVPENQVMPLQEQIRIDKQKVSLFTLYRFITPFDAFVLFLGLFFAAVHGVALPMFTLVVGGITNNFNEFIADGALSHGEFTQKVSHNALYFVYIGIGIIGSGFLESFLLVRTGEKLTARYRKAYLKAIIGQNIAFFDKLGSGEVTTRLINDTTSIQEAISEKSGNIISGVATFITAICISFSSQWKLAIILFTGEIWIIATMMSCSTFMAKGIVKGESVYSTGSSVAEESFSAIRNTIAFGLQEKMAKRFDAFLQRSRKFNEQKNLALSVMLGLLWSGIFWIYALAFWEGSRLIAKQEVSIGKIIVVLVSTLIGSFQLGQIAPNIQFLAKGLAACATINETINRTPIIDSFDQSGEKPESVEGHIQFKNIAFRYPSRPHVEILPNFSLEVKPGETVALVGSSGSGKSTVVGLLERFYLPLDGEILLDGRELSTLNTRWLRQQIGLVSQEPTLFSDSIYENISYGLIGTQWENASDEVKREKVIEACKLANAWDFIQQLTDGLETNVGDRGFLMSGGQKQRIAIARAIISDPKILLLDEATSALDTKSEGIVQDALDRAARSRSTIVIAHRLSTIKDASKIVVMSKGEIVEQGTHHELLAANGTYARLVEAQTVHHAENTATNAVSAASEADSQSDSDELDPKPLTAPEKQLHEDAFVAEDSASMLSRSTTRIAAETKIAGLQTVDASFKNIVKMLWKINQKEQKLIIMGAFLAIALGMGYPSLAMLLGKTVSSIMVPTSQYPEMRHHVNLYSGMFFMVGWEQMFAGFFMIRLLTYSGELLLRGVRLALFRQFLRMDVAFFDHADNSSGSLTSILAKDGKAIEGLGGATFGQIMNSLVMVIGGVITGIAFDWRLGLVGTACVPILVGCGFARLFILTRLMNRGRKVYESSGALAAQYASAVRTVQSLTREDGVQAHYGKVIDDQVKSSFWFVMQSAVVYGLSEGLTPWILALIFWYGSQLLSEGKIGIWAYYVVFIGIVIGAQAAGSVFSYAPDMSKAKQSSSNVLRILEARPEIDTWSNAGVPVIHEDVQGRIEFNDVRFRYPTRPQVPVLRGINLKVEKGEYIALVGGSGSGKSTTIGLIERFYNPLSGNVTLDGADIASLNVNQYRNSIALVQQEPMLYSGTVKENILMGWAGDESEVTADMIEQAARKANIHDFIMSLPEAYDTVVGSKGGMLSGGQKQRIAIARALIRDPKVLLLDEATSALDSESEKVVQAALDSAAKGRTTIAVAHRLSTIQDADCIYVFDHGKIVEQGRHNELLALNGQYAELVRLQSLEG